MPNVSNAVVTRLIRIPALWRFFARGRMRRRIVRNLYCWSGSQFWVGRLPVPFSPSREMSKMVKPAYGAGQPGQLRNNTTAIDRF
jgi:hypothetical protein